MMIDDLLPRLRGVQRARSGWTALCPAHEDHHPSLSLAQRDGRILLKCYAGCLTKAIVRVMGIEMKDLRVEADRRRRGERGGEKTATVNPVTPIQVPGLTLKALAEAKNLPPEFLRSLGIRDIPYSNSKAVHIPYHNPAGELVSVRFRHSLDGPGRFSWRRGDKPTLYGLDLLKAIQEAGWVLLVEGESDCWTARHYNVPALGIPGKMCWRSDWPEHLNGLQVYLWQEPGAEDLTRRVSADLADLLVIPAPDGIKDLSEAHLRGHDVVGLIDNLRRLAVPAVRLRRGKEDARLSHFREQAEPILHSLDPLDLVEQAIRRLGYGGDIKPALVTYLAVTSRLLKMRPGSMPVHLILIGVPSAGKSYTLFIVLALLPPEACHEIDAGSPRVLIYEDEDLQHRAVIFSEADSLPAGEDNPAASAVRNLLQEHRLRYKVVVRDPENGGYRVREVAKPGPTVLITTAVRRLGSQLDTRLFSLDVPDDLDQVRQALATQAALETEAPGEPDPALIAYQGYLQALAPWDVAVPFAEALSEVIGKSAVAPRVLRDFSRLLSLIKAVTIIRHAHRRTDTNGRLIAEIEDYATVYRLVGAMYEGSVTGASPAVREVVQAVQELQGLGPVSVTAVAEHLGISKMAASRRIKIALSQGWLINSEQRKGRPFVLEVGEALPGPAGLPRPEDLRDCNAVTAETDRNPTPAPEMLEEATL